MKKIEELTEAELLALTENEINWYIDFACAEAGVPLLPATSPGNAPTPPDLPRINLYRVAGVFFSDIGDAEKLQAFLVTLPSRGDEKYLDDRWREPKHFQPRGDTGTYEIVTSTSMTEAQARTHQKAIEDFQDAKEKHEAATRKYREIIDKRKRYADDVHKLISEAQSTKYRRDDLLYMFDRYVELAGGDRAIAARFLEKAKPEARELLPDLFVEVAALEVTPALAAAAAGEPSKDDDIPW